MYFLYCLAGFNNNNQIKSESKINWDTQWDLWFIPLSHLIVTITNIINYYYLFYINPNNNFEISLPL